MNTPEMSALPINLIKTSERVLLDGQLVEIVKSGFPTILVKSVGDDGLTFGKARAVDHNKLVAVPVNDL